MTDEALVGLFCGSREWSDREAIRRELCSLPPGSIVTFTLGSRGTAHTIAAAERAGIEVVVHNG